MTDTAKFFQQLRARAKAARDQAIEAAEQEYQTAVAAYNKAAEAAGVKIGPLRLRLTPKVKTSAKLARKTDVSVAHAVREIVMGLDHGKVFSIKSVLRNLPEKHPELAGVSRHTIASALRRLATGDDAPIKVVVKGLGRRPTRYAFKKGEKNAQAATA